MFSKIVVIGHRGVGKSFFLKRNQALFPASFDLDAEIEKAAAKNIQRIFSEDGEAAFRKLELDTFHNISRDSKNSSFAISVGAGFPVEQIPDEIFVLWVQKKSDSDGRIFLNRPRLNPEVSALQEFRDRRDVRDPKFLARADWIWDLPEGNPLWSKNYLKIEKSFLQSLLQGDAIEAQGIWSTLNSWHFGRPYRMKTLSLFKNITWELRDDLLSLADLKSFLLLKKAFLYSFRKEGIESLFWGMAKAQPTCLGFDWDQKLGGLPEELKSFKGLQVKSSHMGTVPEDSSMELKWAPLVSSWSELQAGIDWSKKSLKNLFLPRSENGRWNWYRQVSLSRTLTVQFVSLGIPSALDQPSFYQSQLVRNISAAQGFAAVLGAPVSHSWSPLFHADFSNERACGFFHVEVDRGEWALAFPILKSLGLKNAAITSPLKAEAAQFFNQSEPINTLNISGDEVETTVTDFEGFRNSLKSLSLVGNFLIWGSGALSEGLSRILNGCQVVSAREGLASEKIKQLKGPYILVWASPDSKMPPLDLPISAVLDLNYKESSFGRDLALKLNCPYHSGEEFFIEQAKLQQSFWRKHGT